jgi:hypothetical protein
MLYGSFEIDRAVPRSGMSKTLRSPALIWLATFALVASAAIFTMKDDTTELISRKQSQNDLDSYFKDLDSSDADSGDGDKQEEHHAWSGMDSDTRKYIENKRKSLHKNGGFTTFDKEGHSVPLRSVWSASAAAARLESAASIDSNTAPKSSYHSYSMAELAKMRAQAQSHYKVYITDKKVGIPFLLRKYSESSNE